MMRAMGSIDVKRIVCAVLGVVVGAGFVLLRPEIGLGEQGIACLGVLLGAIVWWVGSVLPAYATAVVMVVLFSVVAGVDSRISFSAFASETWWLLVAAFGLGAGMKKSGLLKRMAFAIVRTFPNTFAAQAAGLMAAGTLVGPLVPSMAVKASMLTPLAMGVGDALGYERFGKPMQGLFLATFCGIRSVAPAVLSASVIGYAMLGLLPADVRAQFDLIHWFIAAFPWFVLVTVVNYVAIALLYRPTARDAAKVQGQDGALQKGGQNDEAKPQAAAQQLGSMSRHEKRMCAIAVLTVAMWVAEPFHHVPAHIVALSAFALTVACGILGKSGLREDISWESLIFVGIAMGLANVFGEVGIQEWVVSEAGPAFELLASNPYAFVIGAALITIALRFVIVSENAYLNIVMVFLVPLCASAGISPWVGGFAMYAVISPWFALYQTVTYLAAFYSVDGQMVRHADAAKYCVFYTLVSMVALVASVPYWQWMGLL